MRLLKRKIKNNFSHNNVIRLVRGGKDYFDSLEHLIDNAKTTLHFQTYIFDADETGTRIANALLKAASRNVSIKLLLDGYASKSLRDDFIKKLTDAGIEFRWFDPLFGSSKFYFGRRLHHKVIVADHQRALIGGINISNRYNDINNVPAWLDFGAYTEGQAAFTLHQICEKIWDRKNLKKYFSKKETKLNERGLATNTSSFVRVRRNDWVRGKNDISKTYLEMLNTAKSDLTIMSSYFLPGRLFRLRMKAAVKRGVKIRVILAGVSDIKLSGYAARYLYNWMLKNNFEIFEYKKTVLHAKVAVCDSAWATIGSYNVNNLSALASIELNLDIKDKAFVNEVEKVIMEIVNNDCEQVTKEAYEKRKSVWGLIASWGSYTIARILLFFFTYNLKREKEL